MTRYVLLAAVMSLVPLAGCSGLQTVYDRCFFVTPAFVDTAIIMLETARQNGLTKSEALGDVFNACVGEDCLNCGAAIVDFVYP